ncbi:hypothetical protein C8R44DRAFT_852693 [Mycena epipterygia]|nr:hypothetical protein C8R44DRAFT_852693 [Mycena epipterygia]
MNHDVDETVLREREMADQETRPLSHTNSNKIFSQLRTFSNNLTANSLGSLFNSAASSSHKNLDMEWNNYDAPNGGNLDYYSEGLTPTPTRSSSPQRRFPGVKSIFTNLASRGSRPSRISIVQPPSQLDEGGRTLEESKTPHYEPLASPLGSDFTEYSHQAPSAASGSFSSSGFQQVSALHSHGSSKLDEGGRTPHYELLASPLGSEFTPSSSEYSHQPPSASVSFSSSDFQQVSASDSYGSSEPDDTPPLTPESLIADIALLSPTSDSVELGYAYEYSEMRMDVDADADLYEYARPHSVEIKAGKRPERPIDFDALLADISNESDAALVSDTPASGGDGGDEDDKDEWYGLEYTLELSTRERRASETHSFSAGEHSKSRESWAAIHQGTIHPFFEDEEYYQWKNWHRYLERQDEKRKHRRGRAFKAHAKQLAWFYADEMHTRDLMSWQMEVYGDVEKELLERLRALETHRPDPYHPPMKHDVGWYLKRSRSAACLRELRALPEPTLQFQKRALSGDT